MSNNKHVWEGWTVQDFIDDLEPMFNQIMSNNSWQKPFKTKEEVKDATTDPKSVDVSESGIPKEPTITNNPDGTTKVTFTEKVDGEILKSSVVLQPGSEISPGLLKRQETAFNLEMSREAVGRGDQAAANYYSDRLKGI